MNNIKTIFSDELQYLDGLRSVLKYGTQKGDRTGTGTISLFRPQTMRFSLNNGLNFPLFTTKFVNFNAVLRELLWFISGSTNINDLESKIWDQWALTEDFVREDGTVIKAGEIGPMYGYILRNDGHGGDPLQETIENIKKFPNSRRHVITLWRNEFVPDESISPQDNVKNDKGCLSTCHGTTIQFYVDGDKLSLSTYQRSCDLGLGGAFNVASYSILLMMVAKLTGLKADQVIYDFGDAHIYNNHLTQVDEWLSRSISSDLPSLEIIGEQKTIDDFKFEHFKLLDYKHQEAIKMPIAV